MTLYENNIYASWLKYTNERANLNNLFESQFDSLVTQQETSMIDVGCGRGSALVYFCNLLTSRNMNWNYVGIDPSDEQLKRFEECLKQNKNVSLQKTTLEDYVPNQSFDLAFAIHSLYHVEDMQEALQKMNNMSRKMMIAYHGKSGISTFQRAFPEFKPNNNGHNDLYFTDIANELTFLGFDHALHRIPYVLDISSCKEDGNIHGDNLIKFFFQNEEMPNEQIKEVKGWIKTQKDIINCEMGVMITK